MKIVEIKPIEESQSYYDELQERLARFFRKYLYYPLIAELGLSRKTIQNASTDALLEALLNGQVQYAGSSFSGKFNASISKRLRQIGAKFDRKTQSYKLSQSELPSDVKYAISTGQVYFEEKMKRIDKKLADMVPEELAEKLKVSDLFDKTLWKADKDFQKNVKNITATPTLTKEQRQKIADEWQNNMKLYIKDWTEDQIKTLRKKIFEDVMSGKRRESLIPPILKITKTIEASHDEAVNKAQFLAHQESRLLMAKFKEVRYVGAGIPEYIWRCVHRPHDSSPHQHTQGNVRYSHGLLDGKVFRWDNPPIVSNPGESVRKANPGQDYNCIPGSNLITLDRSINKIFRRRYTGKLTLLISDNGIIHESTGNHPILTNRGWIAAKDIQIGDYLFKRIRENALRKEMDSKNVETSIEQIFDALSLCIQIRSNALSKTDFHGDIIGNQNVDIISVDRKLCLDRISNLYKILSQIFFQGSYSAGLTSSSVSQLYDRWSLSSSTLMSFLSELKFLLSRHLLESDKISFGTTPDFNSSFNQPLTNRSTSNAVFFRNSLLTHPILIILDSFLNGFKQVPGSMIGPNFNSTSAQSLAEIIRMNPKFIADFDQSEISSFIKPLRVIDKTFRDFYGHVYNLETSNNWYFSQDCIIHNCRCFARPILRKS